MTGLFAGVDWLARRRGDGLHPELRRLLDRDRIVRESPNVSDLDSYRSRQERVPPSRPRDARRGKVVTLARVR